MTSETFVDDFKNDFRFDAMVASLERFKTEKLAHPYDADFSYCIPTGNSPKVMRRKVYIFILGFLTCIVLMIGGLLGMGYAEELSQLYAIKKSILTSFFLGVSLVGCPIFLLAGYKSHLVLRPLYKTRLSELKQASNFTKITDMQIEEGNTFHKRKLVSEEFGFIGHDLTNKLTVFEGVIGRYLIRSQDIISFRNVSLSNIQAIEICFRVADTETLKITTSKDCSTENMIRFFNPTYSNLCFETLVITLGSKFIPKNESLLSKQLRKTQERKINS